MKEEKQNEERRRAKTSSAKKFGHTIFLVDYLAVN